MILGCPEAVRRRNAAGGRGGLSSLVMKVKEFCVGIGYLLRMLQHAFSSHSDSSISVRMYVCTYVHVLS